jgi:tRNA dimethylallyltransferase
MILAICGATAVGKAETALKLAHKIGGEIISVDSRKVFKYMDVGTAKPTKAEREKVPYHLIDIIFPDEKYSAGQFGEDAQKAIREIEKRGKVPMLVGGCGLYLKALTNGFDADCGEDPKIRKELEEEVERLGSAHLHKRLQAFDPDAAAKIHFNDVKRIIRAIEVYKVSGKLFSSLQSAQRNSKPNFIIIGLMRTTQNIYKRIEDRVERIFDSLVTETQDLLNRGYGEHLPSMQGLGYREVCGYLRSNYDLEEAKRLTKRNIRRYAKRQLTWFRGQSSIHWIDADKNVSEELILKLIRR